MHAFPIFHYWEPKRKVNILHEFRVYTNNGVLVFLLFLLWEPLIPSCNGFGCFPRETHLLETCEIPVSWERLRGEILTDVNWAKINTQRCYDVRKTSQERQTFVLSLFFSLECLLFLGNLDLKQINGRKKWGKLWRNLI